MKVILQYLQTLICIFEWFCFVVLFLRFVFISKIFCNFKLYVISESVVVWQGQIHDYARRVWMGRGSDREAHLGIWAGVVSSTRPDSLQDSRGQLGRGHNATEFNKIRNGPTDRPTNTARCRVACPRHKSSKKPKKQKGDRPTNRPTTHYQTKRPTNWRTKRDVESRSR